MSMSKLVLSVAASLWVFAAHAGNVATTVDRDVNAVLAPAAISGLDCVPAETKCEANRPAPNHQDSDFAGSVDREVNLSLRGAGDLGQGGR